jgi:hypothetical protein
MRRNAGVFRHARAVGCVLCIACGARSDLGVESIDASTTGDSTVDANDDLADVERPNLSCGIWPMSGHDPARTARSVLDGPRSAGVQWSIPLQRPSPAAVASDGTLYVTDATGVLHAISSGGAEKWSVTGLNIYALPPAIGCDGTIYVEGGTTHDASYTIHELMVALSPNDGETLWSYPYIPSWAEGVSPTPLPDRIYYANGGLDAFALDGGLEWTTPSFAGGSFALDSVQTAYDWFGPFNDSGTGVDFVGTMIAAISSTGDTAWTVPIATSSVIGGTAVLDTKGTLFVDVATTQPDTATGVYALDTTGSLLWHMAINDSAVVNGPMALAPNGDVYVPTASGLVAITPSTQMQRVVLAGTPTFAVAIDASGIIYVVATKSLVAVRPDDSVMFTFELDSGNDMLSQTIALGDGVAYVSGLAHIYAIGP